MKSLAKIRFVRKTNTFARDEKKMECLQKKF